MSKSKIGGVMASAFIAGALVCGSIFASGNQVMTGGSKQGKALWTDYCGMSKEVQGPVDAPLCPGGQQGCIVQFKGEGIEGVDQ